MSVNSFPYRDGSAKPYVKHGMGPQPKSNTMENADNITKWKTTYKSPHGSPPFLEWGPLCAWSY